MVVMPINRYQIIGHLASGGMGEIWLARRVGPVGFEKLVVLKRPLGATRRSHVAALIDEARLLARINHPNVCQVHDLEEGDAGYFLVLEYLEGISCWTLLAEAERAGAAPEPGAVCGILEQVCDGLDAIHSVTARDGRPAGIVHRDISPGNLFLTENGMAKILDLGIAKTDESDATGSGAGPRGKLPYLSPEQIAGRAVDRRADVFSLGLVLYDLARGRRPEPERVGALAATDLEVDALPAPLAAVIRTAVAIDPDRRYATAGDMAAAIRGAGQALGGSLGRAELARWLVTRFGRVLAARQAQLYLATADTAEAPSITRRVELRSLVRDAVAGPGGDAAEPFATAPLPPPPPLIQERAYPVVDQVQALIASGGSPVGRGRVDRRGRAAVIGLAAVAVAAASLGAAAAWWSERGAASGRVAAGGSTGGPTDGPTDRPPEATVAAPSSATPHPDMPPAPGATLPLAPAVSATPAVSAAPEARPVASTGSSTPPKRPRPPAVTRAGRSPGRLSIDSDPFALIDLDGASLGATPLYELRVAPGRHLLRAETGDGRVQRRAIDVTAGGNARVLLRWAPGAEPAAR